MTGDRRPKLLPDSLDVRESYLLKFGFALLLVVVVVGAVGYVVQSQTETRLNQDVEQKLVFQTETEAERIAEFIDQERRPARLISNHPVFGSANETRIQDYLQTQQAVRDSDTGNAIHYVNVTNEQVIVSSVNGTATTSAWPGLYFQNFNDVLISRPYTNQNGTVVIAFISPVRSNPGTIVAVTVPVSEMEDEFRTPITGGYTQVVDSSGTVIFAENESERQTQYVDNQQSSSQAVSRATDGESGFIKDGTKDRTTERDIVLAYTPVDGTDLVVIKHAPEPAAYQLHTNVLRGISVLVAIALVGIVLIGATVGRSTAMAIADLSAKAKAIEVGEFDVDLETDRRDEIGTLYRSMAAMQDSLREQIKEAEKARQEAQSASDKLQTRNAEIREQKAIISVLNRVLRHNLRNDITVITGHLATLRRAVDEDAVTHADIIDRRLRTLLNKGEKAREIEQLVGTEERTATEIDVVAVLTDEIESFEQTYPEATITTDLPEERYVMAHETIGFVFDNLIENGIEHNSGDSRLVHISVTSRSADGQVDVQIGDDGPGIPDHELETLEVGYETALQHGSGLGLWLVNWLVTEMDGDISFEDRDPTGTLVTVSLPAADDEAH